MARSKVVLGDARRDERAAWMFDRIVASGSLVLRAIAAISASLEGNTVRQQNPHPPQSLPWASWTAARPDGWNCYYKPPGPKTMARGLDRLIDRIAGYKAGNGRRNV